MVGIEGREHRRLAALGAWAALAAVACGPVEGGDDTRRLEQPVVVCAPGETQEGIDVSYYQGDIDWGAVAASGRKFAIARVNDGDFIDPQFGPNWDGIRAAGMIRGAYQFFRPAMSADAQADTMIAAVGVLGAGDLPATLDVEATGSQPADVIASKIHVWMDKVEIATGKRPIIYTGKYFWNDNVVSADFAGDPLWIAAYGPPCPDTPSPWDDWAMWQYSSTGSVPGIAGDVDLDVFNGTMADLEMLAGQMYAAELVSQSYPATMAAGETSVGSLTLKNIGGRTWDIATRVGTTEPRDRESPFATPTWVGPNRPAAVGAPVAPGETYTFDFDLRAPVEPGTYVEHYSLVQEGVAWFGDPGQGGPPDTEIVFEITVVGGAAPRGGGRPPPPRGGGGGGGPPPPPPRSTGARAAASCPGVRRGPRRPRGPSRQRPSRARSPADAAAEHAREVSERVSAARTGPSLR